jgi:regulator of replication initiation timing
VIATIEDIRHQILELRIQIERLHHERAALESELEDMQARVDRLVHENAHLQRELEHLRREAAR